MPIPDTARTLDIAVTPFKTDRSPLFTFVSRVCAAIFIADPEANKMPRAEILKRFYGISKVEAEVLKCLAEGMSLKEIAAQRNVTIHTVRSQVKSIMNKTDTTRQSELIRLVHSGPAILLSK